MLYKANRSTAVLQKVKILLRKLSFLTIRKAFTRLYLDYSYVIYDKIIKESWHKKLELAITRAIRGNNTAKFYKESGLE